MNSLTSHGGTHRSWHTESDVGTRRMIAERMKEACPLCQNIHSLHLFEKRKPRLSLESRQKLPELVKRLEDSLYCDASSKDEYADISTLEQRLQVIVKHAPARTNLTASIHGVNSASSSMIPTPGSTMIPTPGAINSNSSGLRNVMTHHTTSPLQSQGLSSITDASNMVPTPGINTNMLTRSESSNINAGNSMMSGQVQQQIYNSGSSGIANRNSSGQLGLANNMQRPFTYINSNVANGSLHFPNPPMYTSPQFGNMPLQAPHHLNQQLQQHMPVHPTRSSHLVTNSMELRPSGSFYNSVSNGVLSNSMNIHTQGYQASMMIPVPGLTPSQSSTQSQKPLQQSQPQADKFQRINPQQRLNTGRSSQQMEAIKSKLLHQVKDEKQSVLVSATSNSSSLHSLPIKEESQPTRHSNSNQQTSSISGDHHDHANTGKNQPSEEHSILYVEKQPSKEQHLSSHSPIKDREQGTQEPVHEGQEAQQSMAHQTIKVYSQESPLVSEALSEQATGSSVSLTQVGNTNKNLATKPLPNSTTDAQRAEQFLKQQRWLLVLCHASQCTAPEGQCQSTPHCHTARQLWMHMTKCNDRDCQYPRCQVSGTLVRHSQTCRDAQCPVCAPVRRKIAMQHMQAAQSNAVKSGSEIITASSMDKASMTASTDFQAPPTKRTKLEPTELADNSYRGAPRGEPNRVFLPHLGGTKFEADSTEVIPEVSGSTSANLKTEVSTSFSDQIGSWNNQVKSEQAVEDVSIRHESPNVASYKGTTHIKQELHREKVVSPVPELGNGAKSCKSKIKGVSLTELFTPEQIREHIMSLRQWVGQTKVKAEKNQAMEQRMSDSSCQLCAVETLTFDPPPIYCTPCGARIKRNAFYWTMQIGETRHYVCIPCYNDPRAETVDIDGTNYLKSKLEKRRNDEETEEPWVQCDKCEKWQHQVCALFNMRRNEGGQAEYTCPHCLIEEVEKGERKPLPQSAVLGAKDLPRTLLSDHIEQRLMRKLKQERHERARALGKSFDEVPGADSLVIRIVSSVDKKLEVKPRFLEMFQEEDYPLEFLYKSKVLLLFQKIEGVEVCLFGMYVQEFGAEAAQPNQRRVYLSYLDSVKYFRPDARTVNGEALRTFVYHEILIGYLDNCKKRGFTSCYIWACPPLKGEDYILYCHPEIQKTPKSDKLREWYLCMLRKASYENIVVELTNMYDHFFVRNGESKAKVTAARLPYFDGDYWPGAAEDMIMQLQEEEIGRKQLKKGKTKKTVTKRATKTTAQAELASNASKDLQLMHKLGETIYPMKEDFIMVHLQFCCSHCCNFILSGHRWSCKQCKGFHLCDRCYGAEQKCDERERHPNNSKDCHPLFPIELTEPLNDTNDKDEITESEFFDTRQAFLSLCQGNHYQYDTLRRAKHSSMMVLYHLHNPTAPAFVTTCNLCHRDIETGQGWRCETCPDFDLCNSCYSKDDLGKHPHKLSPHPSAAERETQSKEARQQRVLQLRKMLDLLVHASQCGSAQCLYPNCRRVKGLFRHGMSCKVRASGGCHLCKKMWYLLQLHARACKESECRVPRCKDLKEHLRRLQQQMESRRRAAVNEMMRQRTAEAAAGTS